MTERTAYSLLLQSATTRTVSRAHAQTLLEAGWRFVALTSAGDYLMERGR